MGRVGGGGFIFGEVVFEEVIEGFGEAEGGEEVSFLFDFFEVILNIALQFFVADDDVVFFGEFTDSHTDIHCFYEVDGKDAEEEADDEGEGEVVEEPGYGVEEEVVQDEVIERADCRPEEGKEGADDTLNIPEAFGIIPKFDTHALDEDDSADVFDRGHGNAHNGEQKDDL